MKKRPRQIDVARVAGVSPATVSLVLNGRIGGNVRIRPETRQRVLDAIQQLGYVANPVARSLAGGENRLLGVFTYEAIFPIQNQDFYYPFLIGIEEEAATLGYDLLLFTGRGEDGRRTIYPDGINRLQLADGAVLLGHGREKDELISLVQEGYPFVFVGRRDVPGTELAYVAADYCEATATVMAHLFDHQHRSIAYLGMKVDNESACDRFAGYCLAHERFGLLVDSRFVHRVDIQEITPGFVDELLKLGITAFVVEHDSAVDALTAAGACLNKTIPADFSLAMLGDPLSGRKELAPVTAFTIPRRQMGSQSVKLLCQILSGTQPVQQVTLTCQFVPGETVAAPPRTTSLAARREERT